MLACCVAYANGLYEKKALQKFLEGFFMDLNLNYLAKTGYFLLNTLKLPNKIAP
jgi:hypothetical protein